MGSGGLSLLSGVLNGLGENKRLAQEQETTKEHESVKSRIGLLNQLAGSLDPNSPTHAQDIAQILKWAENPLQDKGKKSKTAGPSGAKIDPDEHIGHMSTIIAGLNKSFHGLGKGAKAVGEHVGPFYKAARPLQELDPQAIQRMIGTPEQQSQWASAAEQRTTKSKLDALQIAADVIYGKETAENKEQRTNFLREGITGRSSAAERPSNLGPGHTLVDPTGKVLAKNEAPLKPTKAPSNAQVFDDAAAVKFGHLDKNGNPDPSKLTAQERAVGRDTIARRAGLGINNTRTRTKVAESLSTISDEEMRALAKRELEQHIKPSFGLSAKDPNRSKYNRILAEELVKNPGNASAFAKYKAGVATVDQLTKVAGIVGSLEGAFKLDIQNAEEASANVDRSSLGKYNKWTQFLAANLTDHPELAAYRVAVQTAVNQYARIMSTGARGGGTTSVNAQQHAEELLNAAMPKGTLNAALAQMRKEADNVVTGLNEQIENQSQSLQNSGKPTPAAKKSVSGGDLKSKSTDELFDMLKGK